MLLGSQTIAGLIIALMMFDLLLVALRIFASVLFVLMMFKDSKLNRLLFLTSYIVEKLFTYAIEIIVYVKSFNSAYERDMASEICKEIEKIHAFPNSDFTNFEKCLEVT